LLSTSVSFFLFVYFSFSLWWQQTWPLWRDGGRKRD
jgi:hypothetical protein